MRRLKQSFVINSFWMKTKKEMNKETSSKRAPKGEGMNFWERQRLSRAKRNFSEYYNKRNISNPYTVSVTFCRFGKILKLFFIKFYQLHGCKIACITGLKWNQTRSIFEDYFRNFFWSAPNFKNKSKVSFQRQYLPPSIHFEMKFCFCFWNMVRAKKKFLK